VNKYHNRFVIALCCLIVAVQMLVSQYIELARLRTEHRVTEAAVKLGNDQIRDLMYELQQARIADEAAKTRWFVAGAVAAAEKPDYYREIWHAGYDRGQEVQQMVESLDRSAAFTSGK
jgi:hypothetical protein